MDTTLPIDVRIRRIITQSKIGLLKYFCRLGGAKAAAWFVANKADWEGFKPDRPTVVALYRPLFSKDLEELRKRTNLNWVFINNEFLAHAQSAWVPVEMQAQTEYQKYRRPGYEKYWQRLEQFGLALIERLGKRARIDAIMTSHIDYWHAEGVRLGARQRKTPFLGLCREHMCLPIEQKTVTDYYSGFKFEGDAIAVFGNATRDIFVKSGACSEEQVIVTGPPRLDVWRDQPEAASNRNYVVLLSYRDPDYRAPNSFVEVLKIFLDIARSHVQTSDVVFFIKSKGKEDTEEIRGLAGSIPDNVIIDHSIQLYELLPRARMVVGFNSLSLLEAHFSIGKIVIPYWDDARRSPDELIFNPNDPATREIIAFPESRKEFAILLESAMTSALPPPLNRERRLDGVRQIFHFPSEKTCCAEVEEFVRRFIE